MTKYKLTNKKIGSETIKMLEETLSSLIDNPLNIDTTKLSVFKDSIQIIKDYQPYNSNIHLNSALQYKKITYDVAIFCVLGLNPDAAIEIRKQHHSKQTRSSNNILMQMLDTSAIHKLVDDFAKCEGNPKKALITKKLIDDSLHENLIKITEESNNPKSPPYTKKRKYSTEKKQELINDLAKKEMQKNPTLNRGDLAHLLEEEYFLEIRVGFEQIRKAYFSKYPDF